MVINSVMYFFPEISRIPSFVIANLVDPLRVLLDVFMRLPLVIHASLDKLLKLPLLKKWIRE